MTQELGRKLIHTVVIEIHGIVGFRPGAWNLGGMERGLGNGNATYVNKKRVRHI
jgi:pSer/pThr/pTyr-binding forkhead associated (FHA) protein